MLFLLSGADVSVRECGKKLISMLLDVYLFPAAAALSDLNSLPSSTSAPAETAKK